MTLNRVARWLAFGLAAGAAWLAFSAPAQAIPLFARQTGHNCAACHISFPELTAYGREFKLNGYTFGEAQPLPLAFAVMASYTKVSDNTDHSSGAVLCDGCGTAHIDQASLFFGGKLSENIGMFGQYSVAHTGPGEGAYAASEDNTEFRWVHRFSSGDATLEPDTVVGLNLNNNLTMQDVWNAVPQWRYPWFPESQGGFGPVAAPFIDGPDANGAIGPQRAVGIGAYIWWHKTVYAELSCYRKPWGPFGWLVNGAGNNSQAVTQPSDVIQNCAPYYRAAYSRDWGYNSFEVGIFGIHANTFYDSAALNSAQTQNFNDYAIDTQYQYNKGEPWIFSGAASFIHETSGIQPLFQNGQSSNANNNLSEFNIKGTAYYQRQYGVSLGYTSITGSSDAILYGQGSAGGSATGSPASNFWDMELNYLPLQNLRFTLSYTAFTKLNGGSSNFDGLGNNASGQNTWYGAIWWAF